MHRALTAIAAVLVLAVAAACGSTEEEGSGGGTAGQLADLSQFPTPTGSQDAPQLEPQSGREEGASGTAVEAALTQEQVQEMRARLRSGELGEEERQQVLQQLQSQFEGGQGGGFPGGGGSQAVGSIEGVSGNTITVATELASITVTVTNDTSISITSVLEPAALAQGAQVMVTSERVGGSTLAKTIVLVSEEQGRFGGGQRGQGGQGGEGGALLLAGTVDSIDDNGLTVDTQQGPLPISIDEDTVIVQNNPGTVADLQEGMQVRVSGPLNEDGNIEARSVVVAPGGMESLLDFGGGGRQGG